MKRKISLLLAILILVAFAFSTVTLATETPDATNEVTQTEGETTSTETPEITYDDLYVAEQTDYTMDKLIDGNAYIMVNGDVKFTGEVNGSVFIMANGTVEIEKGAYIADTLYVLAQGVKIDGSVYDIYALTQTFELMSNAYVSRDIRVAAGDVKLRGTIYRDVNLTAQNIDVKDDTTSLLVGGDFNYSSSKEIEGLSDVVKYGEIHFDLDIEEAEVVSVIDVIKDYVLRAVESIVYAIVIFFILGLIAPRFTKAVGTDLKEKGIVAFAIGLLSWVVLVFAIIISIILIFTTVASSISVIAWIAMITIIYISSAIVSISILSIVKEKVKKIQENKGLEYLTLAGIALCLWILQEIPFIGGACSFAIITTGVGLIVRNIIPKKEIETTNIEKTEG